MRKHKVISMAETVSDKYIESCLLKNSEETFIRKMKKESGFEDFSTIHFKVIFEICDSILDNAMDVEREKYGKN